MTNTLINPHIRKANIADARGIAEVQVESWRFAHKEMVPQEYLDNLDIDKKTAGWEYTIRENNPKTVVNVAELNGQVVAWCSGYKSLDKKNTQDHATIAVYVHPDFLRKGIGTKITNKTLEDLKAAGYQKANLWVIIDNQNAINFYEATGWEKNNETKTDTSRGFSIQEVGYTKTL